MAMEKARFGAGCFWGVELKFQRTPGVKSTAVGYSGGSVANPTYEQVCMGNTGHAEVVEVEFESDEVSYEELLDVFFTIHDPTTLNQQGPDHGTQYRSAIYFFSPEQEALARAAKGRGDASKRFRRPIVTEIAPAGAFFRAEEYHQCYLKKQGRGTCG